MSGPSASKNMQSMLVVCFCYFFVSNLSFGRVWCIQSAIQILLQCSQIRVHVAGSAHVSVSLKLPLQYELVCCVCDVDFGL